MRRDQGGARRLHIPDGEPAPTVMKDGIGSVNTSQYTVAPGGAMPNTDKPPYRVPSMAEVAVVPWNGLTVVSTFAGCGGSSTGYRMAGFRVLWANERDEHAQACYRANMRAGTVLDGRDIAKVTGAEILAATGLQAGELDVFDGSPPCQTFSTAGKRNMQDERSDLFFEYIRLVRDLQPRAFVAENVSGMVKGVAKGQFKRVLAELKASGYQVEARLLDAQWLGVPQARQRIIFIGVRSDLGAAPRFPKPLSYRYSVRDALPEVLAMEGANGFNGHAYQDADGPSATVQKGRTLRAVHDTSGQHSVGEVTDAPAPSVLAHRAGTMFLDQPMPAIQAGAGGRTSSSWKHGTCLVPVEMIAGNDAFQPKWAHLDSGPSPTILHGGPHGGSGVFRQGETRRKFTIAELRRICAFPDDFVLVGSYAQQWARLGNAVPPVMMSHISRSVAEVLLGIQQGDGGSTPTGGLEGSEVAA